MTASMTPVTSVQWGQPILLQLCVAVPQVGMFLELSWTNTGILPKPFSSSRLSVIHGLLPDSWKHPFMCSVQFYEYSWWKGQCGPGYSIKARGRSLSLPFYLLCLHLLFTSFSRYYSFCPFCGTCSSVFIYWILFLFLILSYVMPPLFIYFLFIYFLARLHGLWNLSSLTRGQTHAPCSWKYGVFLNHWSAREDPVMLPLFLVPVISPLFLNSLFL